MLYYMCCQSSVCLCEQMCVRTGAAHVSKQFVPFGLPWRASQPCAVLYVLCRRPMPAALAAAPRGRARHVYLHYSIGERIGALCAGRHACPVVAAGCSVLSSCHMMVGCTPMHLAV